MLTRTAALLPFLVASTAHGQDFRLPVAGRWFVMQGGDTLNVNHHMAVRAQWYGMDLMKVGGPSGGELARVADPKAAADYYSWGESVTAPVDGTVRAAVDGLPDNEPGVLDPKNPSGNHVVIAAKGAWVYLAHLQKGSVRVRAGQAVRAGDVLGKVGNSGNTDAPHLHMHVQDAPARGEGSGLNVIFKGIDVELSGKTFSGVDWPLIRGLFVSPTPAGERH